MTFLNLELCWGYGAGPNVTLGYPTFYSYFVKVYTIKEGRNKEPINCFYLKSTYVVHLIRDF